MATKVISQDVGRIEENTLKCVVNIDGIGTGFLVSKPIPGKKGMVYVYLVTNKHMIGDWSMVDPFVPKTSITTYLYSNDPHNPVTPVSVDIADASGNLLPNVKIHANPKIDVAMIDITEHASKINNLDIRYFSRGSLISIEDIEKEALTGVGDQVLALGYPAKITSTKTNKPIIKVGYISSALTGDLVINQDWKDRAGIVKNVSAEGKFFLVDGLIVGGNSGGPIVHPRERKYRIVKGEFQWTEKPISNLVFGIVSFNLPNTGISTIYSSYHILELLDEF